MANRRNLSAPATERLLKLFVSDGSACDALPSCTSDVRGRAGSRPSQAAPRPGHPICG